jgi:large subunit ribosomal protein L4
MATITIYNALGAKTGELELDPKSFDLAVRKGLMKEALIAYLASQRQGTAKTKDRGEVAGGGKKPWRQKGTGRARQGSTRSPQWVGGGRAHGPRPRDYSYQLPSQQRQLALRSSFRWALEQGKLSAVEGLDGADKPKTKAVAGFLAKVGLAGKGALLVSETHQPNLWLSTRNIPKVSVNERRNLCAGEVLSHANLIFTKPALDALVQELKERA